jgi:2-polyprenyl-3-methyl-5-hydroxy-6-metoxy-1,4-benzoquinol methylase
MELSTAVKLIEKGIQSGSAGQVWVDLGAGKGLFTQALARLLPEESIIYAIDKDQTALDAISVLSGKLTVKTRQLDFVTQPLGIDKVDGIILANSLHFVKDKQTFMQNLNSNLKTEGRIIVVEYDMDIANPWVPYPISFKSLEKLAEKVRFNLPTKLHEVPSSYNRANIYAAVLDKGA